MPSCYDFAVSSLRVAPLLIAGLMGAAACGFDGVGSGTSNANVTLAAATLAPLL